MKLLINVRESDYKCVIEGRIMTSGWIREAFDNATIVGEDKCYQCTHNNDALDQMIYCHDCLKGIEDHFEKEDGQTMTTFNIYFSDLNEDAKKRLLEAVGAESASDMNWDIDTLPIAMYDFEDNKDDRGEQE